MKLIRAFALSSMLLAAFGCSVEASSSEETGDAVSAREAPLARFNYFINNLKGTIENAATVEDAANALLASGRPVSFSLQSLCRIYGSESDEFGNIRDDFKGLEDGIGQYDKWNGIYQEAVSEKADAATLARLKKTRDDALVTFTKMLTSKGWRTEGGKKTRMTEIEEFLQKFPWQSRKGDREVIFKRLSKELGDIAETTYDMKKLEYGDGVHELRRDIRWVLMEQTTLNGVVILKDRGTKCPIPAYADILNDQDAASTRYAQLSSSALEPYACKLSPCVVIAAAKAVDDIGEIKDAAEKAVNIAGDSDVVPVALQAKAQAIYDEVRKNKLIETFQSEIEACRTTNNNR